MGFIEGLFGKKRDEDFDWLDLKSPIPPHWDLVCTEGEMDYEIDRTSCFKDGDIVWWRQRTGISYYKYDYLICGASLSARSVLIPITRTLADPELEQVGKDVLRQRAKAEDATPFGECLKKANMWSQLNGYTTIPPYVFYAMGIVEHGR
ncbi:MAG: hypothetical protein OJF55_002439 [Rhodanobacteraceae bacterium]|jgi:hypothetical protein|nr:MAG: hypothetical protein OJF55_002439 [Rhodanobacteraceae bacterium]